MPHPRVVGGERPARGHTMAGMDLDALYHGPRQTFVERRAALARQVRVAGDREAAAGIARRPRPPLTAWAVNQVAAGDRDLVTDLLAAASDAVVAQRAAAAGGAGGEALREASARARGLVDDVVRAAEAALEAAGHPLSESTRRRLRTTVQGAGAGSAADREALWRGHLDRDLEPTGFGPPDAHGDDAPELAVAVAARPRPARQVIPAAAIPAAAPARSDPAAVRSAERQVTALQRAAAQAADHARRLRERAERLAQEAKQAAAEAAEGERGAAAADAELSAAAARLQQLRAR